MQDKFSTAKGLPDILKIWAQITKRFRAADKLFFANNFRSKSRMKMKLYQSVFYTTT